MQLIFKLRILADDREVLSAVLQAISEEVACKDMDEGENYHYDYEWDIEEEEDE